MTFYQSVSSPWGEWDIFANEEGITKVHPSAGQIPETSQANTHILEAVRWFEGFASGLQKISALPKLAPAGTAFQKKVWAALLSIPPGTTFTYSQVASQLGSNNLTRAVARAIGQNPIAILIPCHRIIGKNGSLTGYAWGLEKKAQLLAHEASNAIDSLPSQVQMTLQV